MEIESTTTLNGKYPDNYLLMIFYLPDSSVFLSASSKILLRPPEGQYV